MLGSVLRACPKVAREAHMARIEQGDKHDDNMV